jgi:MFS family permease
MQRTDPAPVRRLWVGVLCGYLALGATLQELPGYVVSEYRQGPAVVGLVVGAAFAATALTRPFAGRAGDAGKARSVVMAGGAITALAAAGHLIAPNVAALLVARLLMGLGEAALFSGGLPWVLAGTPAHRRGRVAGWFGLSMWSGLTAGPLLAVLLHRLGGSTAVWCAVAALPIMSTVLSITTRPQLAPTDPAPIFPASVRAILPAGVGLPGLCLGLAAYGYGSLTALLVLYLTDDQIGGQDAALAVYSMAFLVTRALGSPLVDRFGGTLIARLVLIIEAGGLILLAAIPTAPAALAGAAIIGVGIGIIYPATTAITLHRTDAVQPGATVGSMTSLWDLGILIAGPIGGLLAAHVGYRPAFAVAAGVAGFALAITFTLRSTTPAASSTPTADQASAA